MLPEMAAVINGSVYDKVSASNSWTSALLEAAKNEISLVILMFYNGSKLIAETFDGVKCYAIPRTKNPFKYEQALESYLKDIRDFEKPDVVHIHGTEYPHTYSALRVFDPSKTVVSIQGLVSVIERYYESSISTWDIVRNLTLRNIVFRDSIIGQKRAFARRGRYEVMSIKLCKNVIGRTLWDKVHCKTINPGINYFHLDELLREPFFSSNKWTFESCKKHTIFISQASYPIKGLHKMIEALSIVKREYPDVKLRIAGKPFLNHGSLYEKLSYSGYAKYVNKLLHKYGLEDSVEFTGLLDAEGMIREYLSCNVYVCPSSIENSPNSMCEAQILGIPCVVSDVGGCYDMTQGGSSVLMYRFEEYEIMAYHICNIFRDPNCMKEKIRQGIDLAVSRHDKGNIISGLLSIYSTISNEG